MNKKSLLSILAIATILVVNSPAFAIDAVCKNNATQLSANKKSLKKVSTALAKADKELKSLKKKQSTGQKKFDRYLGQSAKLTGDFASEIAGLLGATFASEPILTSALYPASPTPDNVIDVSRVSPSVDSTVTQVYDKIANKDAAGVRNGRGVFLVSDTIGGRSITASFAIVANGDTDEQTKILNKINTDLGPKIFEAMNKRIDAVIKYKRSPLLANIKKLYDVDASGKLIGGTIFTLSGNRDALLNIQKGLLDTKRDCDAK